MVTGKHILFIVENNCVFRDRRVWGEALAARELGYIVSVISPTDHLQNGKPKRNLPSLDGIRIFQHPRPLEGKHVCGLLFEYANALFWEFLLSARVFFTRPFHIIHAANPPDHIFLIAILYKLFGVKFIFDHHDITPEAYVAKFGKSAGFSKILRLMERLTIRTADVVISTNESYRRIATGRGRKPPSDVFVVRNGPDLSKIPNTQPNPSLREGFTYLVGYVGIIAQQEGIENLLLAAQYLINEKQRTDIRFIVVGTGPHWEAIVRLCKDMGLDKYFQFTGYISDSELYEILSTVDVCVNPEYGNEFTDQSTMIKIMEYMTFERPIVQFYTREGEVTAGEAASYIRENSPTLFADELLLLLENPTKRKAMGKAGRRRIEGHLCWESQKLQLKKAYDRAIAG
jgi:glycosyltransferase involved in cell wall biosynthesis